MSPKRTTQSSVKPASKPSMFHGMKKDSTWATNARASSAVRGLLSGISGPRDFADAVVVGVADIDRPVDCYCRPMRPVERRSAGRAAIPVAALAAASHNRRDGSRVDVDPADHMVFGIHDQKIALAVDNQLLWCIEDGGASRSVVAAVPSFAGTGDGRYDAAFRVDGPQCAALPLENVDGPVGGNFDGAGAEDPGGTGRPEVTRVLGLASAGEGPDHARGEIDDAQAMVRDIGDEQPVLRRVERQAIRLDHAGARRRSAVAAKSGRAVAGEGSDHAGGAIDPADTVIMSVGNIGIAGPVNRDAVRLVE